MRHTLATMSMLLFSVWSAAPVRAQTFVDASGQIPSGSPFNASYTENVDFADVDLDGDFDAAFADGGDQGDDQNRLWVNLGALQGGMPGFFSDETAARLPAVLDSSRDAEFADLDGDGDPDIGVANHSSDSLQPSRFWINTGGLQGGSAGFYVDETQSRWVGVGGAGSSVWPGQVLGGGGFFDFSGDQDYGDLDGDGDLDLVHSSYGDNFSGVAPSRLFLNDGLGFFSEFNPSGFQLTGPSILPGDPALWAEGTQQSNTSNASGANADIASTTLDVELGDIDGDLDLDLLQGARNELPRMFVNRLNETGNLILRDVSGSHFPAGYSSGFGHYEQEMGDFDSDDDLDIYGVNWLSPLDDNTLTNQGDGKFAGMTALPSSSAIDNEADFGDYDNDGDIDVFVASFSGQDRLYRNEVVPSGVHSYSDVTALELPSDGGPSLDADWTDIEGDGDYDVMIAHDNNVANTLFRNQSQVADTWAPRAVGLEQAVDRVSSAVPTRIRVQVYDNAPYYYTWYADVVLDFRVDGGIWYAMPMRSSGGQVFQAAIPGAMIGAIEYRVRATDRSGNTGTSVVKAYTASDGGCNGSASFYCTAKVTSIPGCAPTFALNGVPSASAINGFTVDVLNVPGGNPGLFLYTTNGAAATPIQNAFGFLCIQSGPGMFRIGAQLGGGTSGVCDGGYGMNFNQYMATQTQDPSLGVGSDVDVQCWYRDPPNPGTANFTQALRFTVCP